MSDSASTPNSASSASANTTSAQARFGSIGELVGNGIAKKDQKTGLYKWTRDATDQEKQLYLGLLETANKIIEEKHQAEEKAKQEVTSLAAAILPRPSASTVVVTSSSQSQESVLTHRGHSSGSHFGVEKTAEPTDTTPLVPTPQTPKPFPTRRLQIIDYLNLIAFTLACITLGAINYGAGALLGLSWDIWLIPVLGFLAVTELTKAHFVRKDTPDEPSRKRNYRFALFAGISAGVAAIIATSYHLFLATKWGAGAGIVGHAAKAFVTGFPFAAVQVLFTLTVLSLLVNAIWDFAAGWKNEPQKRQSRGLTILFAALMGIFLPFGLGVFPLSIFGFGEAALPAVKLTTFVLAAFGAVAILIMKLREPKAASPAEPVSDLSDSTANQTISRQQYDAVHRQFTPDVKPAEIVGQQIHAWFTGDTKDIKAKIDKFITDAANGSHAINKGDGDMSSQDSSTQFKGLLNNLATDNQGKVNFGEPLKESVQNSMMSMATRRRAFIDYIKKEVVPYLPKSGNLPNFDTIFTGSEIAIKHTRVNPPNVFSASSSQSSSNASASSFSTPTSTQTLQS